NTFLIEIEKLKKDTKGKLKAIQIQDDENAKMKETIQKHLQTIQSNERQLLEKENEMKKMQRQHQEGIVKLYADMETIKNDCIEKEKQTSIYYQLIQDLKEKNAKLTQGCKNAIESKNPEQREEIELMNQHSSSSSSSFSSVVNFDLFRSAKLLKTFHGHTSAVSSIAYLSLRDEEFLCSGSLDKTIRVWDMKTTKQVKVLNRHLECVWCVKFSSYHYHDNCRVTICSASDKVIQFWDLKTKTVIQSFTEHINTVSSIEFSPFNRGRYLCSGSFDTTVRLWDIDQYIVLHTLKGHTDDVLCVEFSPLQSSANDNHKSNGIGIIGGNGYTICSGSYDKTIRLWDVETAKELTVFKGHDDTLWSVKYSPYGSDIGGSSGNIICSGSWDKTVRLWDIRSKGQIQVFNGHTNYVTCVDFSPFTHIIYSGSNDNTIRFWDVRTTKQMHIINGNARDVEVSCLLFYSPKSKINNSSCGDILCYGSTGGSIHMWG
ncbi:WD-40 repeat protein, partial [Reticulomyxa filosa]